VPTPATHDAANISSLWRPLHIPIFRNLLLADVASDVGTFMQNVGAAWLMLSLNASPLFVALTQTASALPFFLFALPAGAVGDIVDRRKLVLFTQGWMISIAALLSALTFAKLISPVSLLLLTFALSAGDAFESPTWRAIFPELVQEEDLAAASALNGIEFNIARAVGPGLGGAVIALAGVASAFVLNTLSFLGVIFVVARWKRPKKQEEGPAETLSGATIAAVRYVRYSPEIRLLAFRSGVAMFFASSMLALLPSVAHSISKSPLGYGLLLGCFGLGAILGAVSMKPLRDRQSPETVVAIGVALFGFSLIGAGSLHSLSTLWLSTLFAGAAWILFISLFNVLVLNHAPGWVRARVLAVFLLVNQGALSAGSAFWGALAGRLGLHTTLIWAGIGALLTTVLGLFLQLPDANADLTPWNHWRLPDDLSQVSTFTQGPVLVTVDYDVFPEQERDFLRALHDYERIRRRDGAFQWGIFQDMETPGRFLETFLTSSWGEHLRQHERATEADRTTEERVRNLASRPPKVTHLVKPSEFR
jgi:MFS family permease